MHDRQQQIMARQAHVPASHWKVARSGGTGPSRAEGPVAPNKANFAADRRQARIQSRQTNPIRPGHARPGNPKCRVRNPRQTRNPNAPNEQARLGTRAPNKPNLGTCWAEAEHAVASNKANPGRGGLGIDDGLRIIDDLEPQTPGAALRQTKPISGRRWETGGRSGSSYDLQPPVFALDAPNKPNLARGRRPGAGAARAKQTQFGSQGPSRAEGPVAPNKANLRAADRKAF